MSIQEGRRVESFQISRGTWGMHDLCYMSRVEYKGDGTPAAHYNYRALGQYLKACGFTESQMTNGTYTDQEVTDFIDEIDEERWEPKWRHYFNDDDLLRGLDVDPNHVPLWSFLVARINDSNGLMTAQVKEQLLTALFEAKGIKVEFFGPPPNDQSLWDHGYAWRNACGSHDCEGDCE